MLRRLSGDCHEVYTGVTVVRGDTCVSQYERSLVRFRKLEEDEIQRYIATGEPMDKAGAYGAQGRGALFVERIEGDFFTVMGLPLCRLGKMLKEQGVSIL
jgi:septum formation protein